MEKSELLETISFLIDEEIARVRLEEDEALRLSDQRRKEFLKTIGSNPPSHNSGGHINEEGILPDPPPPAGGPPPDSETAPVDASPEMGDPMSAGAPAGQTSDLGDAMGAGGAGPTGAPGTGGPEGGGDPLGGEGEGMDDLGGDAGGDMGGGGGMGGGFGGGGGGGGMDLGGEGEDAGGAEGMEDEPPEPEPTYNPFKDADTTEDRLQVILDTAESIAAKTQDPQVVLKALKGLIQNGFSQPEEAAKVIADLFDTNNPVLQQVSRRLNLFMTGL